MWKRLEERISGPRVILQVLQQLAARQPLLVILEDIHWLDRESAVLLDKMLEEMAHLPILFALTGRHALENAKTHLLRLGGLAGAAINEVAQRAFGGRALEDSLAAWISGKSSGNPLYAQELCHALQHANAILLDRESGEVRWTQEAPALPLSLHELLLARLDEAPLSQQDVLKRAAVMGVTFETAGLLSLCQDRMSTQEAELALERITQAGFVAEGQSNSFHFNHPLMQEAIYATLSFSQRQQWHTQIGDWLASRQPEQFLELIAYHYLRGNNALKAAQFARRAGDKARERGAYAGAADYFDQVLKLDNAPEAEKMAAAESKGDMLVLQKFYSSAGEFYTQAETMGSLSAPGKRAIVSGNLEQLAETEFTPTLQGWAEGSKAWLLAQSDQLELALRTAQEALKMAENSAREAIELLLQKLQAREKPGPYEVWLQHFTQALQVSSSS
jgi:predicted ATPase